MPSETVRHLQAAEGYLELGMFQDALDELELLDPEAQSSPQVLLLQMHALQALKRWDAGAARGEAGIHAFPDCGPLYLVTAYCVRRARSLAEAYALLTSAESLLKGDALFHYNLACYECQLGNLTVSLHRLEKAFEIDPKFRMVAATDSDLEPLWKSLMKQGAEE